MFRRIAWRLQALAEGDLTERARERARELARDADLMPAPVAGIHALSDERKDVDGRDKPQAMTATLKPGGDDAEVI